MSKQLTIDPEFKELIPPLSPEEYSQLEQNILSANKCREALITWNGVLVDGHNRYSVCTEHGIDFQTDEMPFDSREAVKLWIVQNQLGRRNLTEEQMTYYRGKQHEMEKGQRGGNHGNQHTAKAQNATLPKADNVAERLAKHYNVSPDTIKRDAKYAKAVDAIGEVSPVAKQKILSGESGISKKELEKLSKSSKEVIETVATDIKDGTYQKPKNKVSATDEKAKAIDAEYIEIVNTPPPVVKKANSLNSSIISKGMDYTVNLLLQSEGRVEVLNTLDDIALAEVNKNVNWILGEVLDVSRRIDEIVNGRNPKAYIVSEPPTSKEERVAMFESCIGEKTLSYIYMEIDGKEAICGYYGKLEQELGLCDNGKLLVSYEDYKLFIADYDPDKHDRIKIRIAKIKSNIQSA